MAAWYRNRGYEVLDRNWRCRDGELDLVARRDGTLVFCEVKARSSAAFGLPAEAVTPAKQARVRRLGALWLAARRAAEGEDGRPARRPSEIRFDVACVLAGRIEVLEGAF